VVIPGRRRRCRAAEARGGWWGVRWVGRRFGFPKSSPELAVSQATFTSVRDAEGFPPVLLTLLNGVAFGWAFRLVKRGAFPVHLREPDVLSSMGCFEVLSREGFHH